MAYTDINSEDRLVQKAFAEHLQTALGIKKMYRESFPKPLVEIAVEKGEIGGGAGLDAN